VLAEVERYVDQLDDRLTQMEEHQNWTTSAQKAKETAMKVLTALPLPGKVCFFLLLSSLLSHLLFLCLLFLFAHTISSYDCRLQKKTPELLATPVVPVAAVPLPPLPDAPQVHAMLMNIKNDVATTTTTKTATTTTASSTTQQQ
jgi:hypothetical protein